MGHKGSATDAHANGACGCVHRVSLEVVGVAVCKVRRMGSLVARVHLCSQLAQLVQILRFPTFPFLQCNTREFFVTL